MPLSDFSLVKELPFWKRNRKSKINKTSTLLLFIFLVLGLISAAFLVARNQDLRQRAQENACQEGEIRCEPIGDTVRELTCKLGENGIARFVETESGFCGPHTTGPAGCTSGSSLSCIGKQPNDKCSPQGFCKHTVNSHGGSPICHCVEEDPIEGDKSPVPTATLPPDTEPTPPTWQGCGSCNSCGRPAEQCVTSPEGQCLWDPGTCGTGGSAPPCTVEFPNNTNGNINVRVGQTRNLNVFVRGGLPTWHANWSTANNRARINPTFFDRTPYNTQIEGLREGNGIATITVTSPSSGEVQCTGSIRYRVLEASPTPTPSPTPTLTASPTFTPSPTPSTGGTSPTDVPTLTPTITVTTTATNTSTPTLTPAPVCVNISLNNLTAPISDTPPRIGHQVSLTCSPIVGAVSYDFRVRLPNNTYQAIDASTITNNISTAYQIQQAGAHLFQCRVCYGDEENTCTEWE